MLHTVVKCQHLESHRMTITVNLSPETQETLQQLADSVGDDLKTYATRVLICAVNSGLDESSPYWPLGIPVQVFHEAIRVDRSAYLG